MKELDTIISKACAYMNCDESILFSTNQENYVDARAIIFTLFFDIGLTDTDSANYCHISRQSVNKLRNSFRLRMRKWSVRQAYKELKQSLQ